MPIEKVLIAAKTYPAISITYDELVCTAGLREDGSWIRLFPIQYRQQNDIEKKYKKWDWVEINVEKNKSDHRVESHKPLGQDAIKIIKHVGTGQGWYERKQLVLEKGTVFYSIEEIIRKNREGLFSLATFKPTKIIDVEVEPVDREWDADKLRQIELKSNQNDMFEESPKIFKVVDKLPYKFSYKLEDVNGKSSTMMIEDWELGALYWNVLKKYKDEKVAIAKVKQKYDEFARDTDLHLFLGTTKLWDKRGSNPFVIIGTFTPPIDPQPSLL